MKNPDPLSYLFDLDKESSTSSVLIERLNTNEKIQHMCTAKVITPANEVPGELLIGESCLYFVADDSMLETDLTEVCSQVFVMWHCMWLQSQLLLFKCRAFWWDWLLYVMCKIYLSSHITKVKTTWRLTLLQNVFIVSTFHLSSTVYMQKYILHCVPQNISTSLWLLYIYFSGLWFFEDIPYFPL